MNKRKPTHPGEIVRHDIMESLGLNVTQAAEHLNCSRKHLSAFLNGRARCTVELAVKLAKATGTSAQSWLNMQMHYDLWEAENSKLDRGVKPFKRVA
jgi:addiction module HigA family antidote